MIAASPVRWSISAIWPPGSGSAIAPWPCIARAWRCDWALGDLPGTAAALEKVAWVVAEDDPEAAARVLGAADAMRETIRARVPPSALGEYERGRQGLEARLGTEAFDVALKSGRGLSAGAALATLPL